jgi:coenzyme PQQ precursor peptide PqqA
MQNEWKAPEFEEICLNCEVASYESGELESSH